MKQFNINRYIYIQILNNGWEHLRNTVDGEYITHCILSRKIIINDTIYFKLQMHEVFQLFPMYNGSTIKFNTTILFDDCDLKQFIKQ